MTTANDPLLLLHKAMEDSFTEEDLQAMCFELGEDPENIGGDTKVLRCWKMIYYFRQRERLPDLMGRIEANRPNLMQELAAIRAALQQMSPAQMDGATLAAAAAAEEKVAAPNSPPATPATLPTAPSTTAPQAPATPLRDIVRKYAKALAAEGVYLLGAIPKDLLENALASYAGAAKVNGESALVLMDVSVVSNGGAGMLLTDKAIYYKPSLTNERHQVNLADVYSVTSKKDIFGKLVLVNGNIEFATTSLSDEQLGILAQMLAECAGVKE